MRVTHAHAQAMLPIAECPCLPGRTLRSPAPAWLILMQYAILMPPTFEAKEGKQLWPGVRLGKFLGAGAQVRAQGWPSRPYWQMRSSYCWDAGQVVAHCVCRQQRALAMANDA